MFWLAVLIIWLAFLLAHPVATLIISFTLLGVFGACVAGGKGGDESSHHGGRWLS